MRNTRYHKINFSNSPLQYKRCCNNFKFKLISNDIWISLPFNYSTWPLPISVCYVCVTIKQVFPLLLLLLHIWHIKVYTKLTKLVMKWHIYKVKKSTQHWQLPTHSMSRDNADDVCGVTRDVFNRYVTQSTARASSLPKDSGNVHFYQRYCILSL